MLLTFNIVLFAGIALDFAIGAQVTLPFGIVNGNLLQNSNEYLGIPFAAKPVRFMPPTPWTALFSGGILEARQYTPACMQRPDVLTSLTSGVSEDCLHLNIYTPLAISTDGTGWPVMVWIHGGGLNTGSAMLPLYNGSNLAAKEKVIVAAINYRLNFFGFGMALLPNGKTSANNGFRDQREAFRWVRKHISAFGGDACRVTIFGESAGGQSATTHILSLGSSGLFDRAISESGGDMVTLTGITEAQGMTESVSRELNCTTKSPRQQLGCLQRAATDALLNASNAKGPGAVLDMDVYEAEPLTLVGLGKFNKVPFLFGNNADEGNLLVYPPFLFNTTLATAAHIRCAITKTFGVHVGEQVLQLYAPVETIGIDNRHIAAEILGAALFHCGNRRMAQALSKAGVAPWVYSFNRQPSCTLIPGAYHGVEVPYVFQNLDEPTAFRDNSTCKISSHDRRLSEKISAMWAAFARTGTTDQGWQRFGSPGHEVSLNIDLGLLDAFDMQSGRHRSQCDAMDRIGALSPMTLGTGIEVNLFLCQQLPPALQQNLAYV